MNSRFNELPTISSSQTSTSAHANHFSFIQKPIELYVFIDPLCSDCWKIEPYLKKLQLEYGHFFTLRPIISSNLKTLNNRNIITKNNLSKSRYHDYKYKNNNVINFDKPIQSSWSVYLAIKAAELQGKSAGKRFLNKIQEYLFLNKKNISNEEVLLNCAKSVNLDLAEFKKDLYSTTAKKALLCDINLLQEMNVDQLPTIVLFNQLTNEDGIKLSGLYSYDIYVELLSNMLNEKITSVKKPPLEDYLAYYKVVACKEVAIVYGWSYAKTKKEMKKLQLKQLAKEVSATYGSFWKFTGDTI